MKRFSALVAPRVLVVVSTLFCVSLFADQGMVLETQNTAQYGDGPLVIKYLSTGQVTTLIAAGVYGPCFSPDGKQIVYPYNRAKLMTMNVDGTNQKILANICLTAGSKEPYCSWCTDGYIYWSQCDVNIYRIKADGSMAQPAIVFASTKEVHNMEVDNAGDRCGWTKPPPDINNTGWWSNSILQFSQNKEIEFSQGCQISISPDGNFVTRSNGGHDQWYIMKYGPTDSADWYTCNDASCANYVYYGPDPAGSTHYMIRWSRNDSAKILFTIENTFDGYLYDWITKAPPVKIGTGLVWDYFKTEIHNANTAPALVLTPANVIINLIQGATPDSARITAALTNTTTTMGALSISRLPAWLKVTINGAVLTGKIVTSALTAFGSYDTVVTVTDAASGLKGTFEFTLNYAAPSANPIIIYRPVAGGQYRVGDSLRVNFDANCDSIPSVTVSISVDNGMNWMMLTASGSRPCGKNQTFAWKILPNLTIDGTAQSTISQNCLLRVSNYAGAGEAISGKFTISSAAAVDRPLLSSSFRGLHIGIDASGGIRIVPPANGTVELFDPRGIILARLKVLSNVPAVIDGGASRKSFQSGMRLIRFSDAGGTGTAAEIVGR